MLRTIASRLLSAMPTLVAVIVMVFFLQELSPTDPATSIAGENATEPQVEAVRHRLGLDKPIGERFLHYLEGLFRPAGNRSWYSSRPVWDSITAALPLTISLTVLAMTFAVLLGVPAGMCAALRPGSAVDRVVSALAAVSLAVPAFLFGLLLLIPFSLTLGWFPATGYSPFTEGPWAWLKHLTLPAIALALPSAAILARQTRGAFVDTMSRDFILAARSFGLRRRQVLWTRGLKNAAIPIVTVFGLMVGNTLSGAVIIEQVFALPGLGSLAFTAVLRHDLPVVQAVVLLSALFVLIVNIAVDVSYSYFNPRLRDA